MKKILYGFAGLAVLALAASCSQEESLLTDGEGSISIRTSVSTDVEVVSRDLNDDLAESCMVWISNSKGLVRKYDKLADVPAKINLLSGHYIAEAWAGDSVSASFDKRWFKGAQEFDVSKGQTTQVAITCKVANVVASVNYAEGLEEVLTDFTMTVGHDRGSLTFDGRDERKGYFMMPSTDKNLTYTLKGTQIDGSEFTHTGVIENAQPATEYALTVKYTPVTNEVGGAVFTIIVDRTEIKVTDEREIIAAPKVEGYGFDLSQTVMGAQGTIGQRSVYITSARKITSLVLKSPLFENIAILGGDDFDFLNQSEEGKAAVNNAGIYLEDKSTNADESMLKLIFSDEFVNNLTDGEYAIAITATDAKGNATSATLNLMVSDAPVQTLEVDNSSVTMRTATLRGRTSKEVEKAGFKYRQAGAAEWIYVEGVAASRSIAAETEFTAQVSGLEAYTEYEYCATCELANGSTFDGAVAKFTTLDGPQLPNAGMESWCMDGKITYISESKATRFWDSGNTGSASMGSQYNLTVSTTSPKHSGDFAASLTTKKVVVAMAAGNLFTGEFLGTEGMKYGILGWGRPFTGEPKALKVWVKYTPVAITDVGSGTPSGVSKGDMDSGLIYIALLDDSTVSYNGKTWPVIVRTQDLENYSFKKDAANVIAYGEHLLSEATPGNELIEITIPIEYVRQGVTPSNILVVCAASRYGDYYTGGTGSQMIVDDFKLVY